MIIIDKIKDPAPFFTRKEIPNIFKTTLDEQKYWAKEKKYWLEGYNVDINGMLYFYATQIMLKNRRTGELYYPTVRDADVFIFNELKAAMDNGQSPFIIKGRGIGLSSIGMNMPFYFFRTMPGSTCIATSRDKKTLGKLFNDKTMIAYDEMNPYIKPDLVNKNQTSSESFLKLGMKYLDDRKQEKYAVSELLCRDTQESDKAANNFSGAGAIYGFADEAPLMQRFSIFFDSAIECFMDHENNRMAGLLLNGGTCEDTIKPEDVQRIQDVWENASTYRIRPVFVSATYGKHMINGHSDHKRAEEEILQRRAELDKLPDKTKLRAYIKNNPLNIDEIFEIGRGGKFSDFALQKINEQKKALIRENPPMHSYSIEIDSKRECTAYPNKKSDIIILEHPKPEVKYILGVDSISTTSETSDSSSRSKFSLTIMKGIDPESELQFAPIATYNMKPNDFDEPFMTTIDLLRYYNQFGNAMITGERNATGSVLVGDIIKTGLKNLLIPAWDISMKGYTDTKKPWFHRTEEVVEKQYQLANTYFKKYSQMVKFKKLLEDCEKPYGTNVDQLDSFLACLYGFRTGDLLGDKPKEQKVFKMEIIVGYINGVPQWETKEYIKKVK